MTNKEKIGFSILSASIGTFFFGARRSWQHLENNKTEYLIIFFGLFIITLIYFFIFRKTTEVICPQCEYCFETTKLQTATCPKCMVKVEKLKGYYKRHQDKSN